jgi:hypothetical protein
MPTLTTESFTLIKMILKMMAPLVLVKISYRPIAAREFPKRRWSFCSKEIVCGKLICLRRFWDLNGPILIRGDCTMRRWH